MSNRTTISFAIYEKDSEAWGVGAEILEGHNVYHIFSYYLPRNEFPSRRRVIHYMFSELFPNVREEHEGIRFVSTLAHFGNNFAELNRKSRLYSNGKWIDFRKTQSVRRHTVMLAIDAVKRRHSISERLE
jgi:hypothetical protein